MKTYGRAGRRELVNRQAQGDEKKKSGRYVGTAQGEGASQGGGENLKRMEKLEAGTQFF